MFFVTSADTLGDDQERKETAEMGGDTSLIPHTHSEGVAYS